MDLIKNNIIGALRGEYGFRELPEVGEEYDDCFTVIICPVCGNKTLDNYDVCRCCGWEYDGFSEEHFSAANGTTLLEYRKKYYLIIKEMKNEKINFGFYNAHPLGLYIDDCVKRAITVTTGMDYSVVARELNRYKKVTGAERFNTGNNPDKYVEHVLGANKIVLDTCITARQFCQLHQSGRYILVMREHWSACISGIILDTWDCSNEYVYTAYAIEPVNTSNLAFRFGYTVHKTPNGAFNVTFYDGNRQCVEKHLKPSAAKDYIAYLNNRGYHDLTYLEEII